MSSTLLLSLVALAAPPGVGDAAADFTLATVDGESTSLAELNEFGPVVLVVLRGFPNYQCPLCSRQVGDFMAKADELATLDAELAFVYPADEQLGREGTRKKAQEFLENAWLPDNVTVLLDPGYSLTERYGLRWAAPNETAYPSTFVIDRGGIVRSATISKTHGGRTAAAAVLEEVKALD